MYKEIDPFDYMTEILQPLKKGVLLTTKKDEGYNTMTIAWGQIGIEWGIPIFTVFVRSGRYTHELLDCGEFSINIPYGTGPVGRITGYAGTKSGRNTDKIADLGLTVVDGRKISVPGFKELPMTLECRIIYKQKQDAGTIQDRFKSDYYPSDVASDFPGSNRDYHTMFYGEIVGAHIIEK